MEWSPISVATHRLLCAAFTEVAGVRVDPYHNPGLMHTQEPNSLGKRGCDIMGSQSGSSFSASNSHEDYLYAHRSAIYEQAWLLGR